MFSSLSIPCCCGRALYLELILSCAHFLGDALGGGIANPEFQQFLEISNFPGNAGQKQKNKRKKRPGGRGTTKFGRGSSGEKDGLEGRVHEDK